MPLTLRSGTFHGVRFGAYVDPVINRSIICPDISSTSKCRDRADMMKSLLTCFHFWAKTKFLAFVPFVSGLGNVELGLDTDGSARDTRFVLGKNNVHRGNKSFDWLDLK